MNQQSNDIDKLKAIKYIVIDVDGTMTDGGIYYDEHGNEYKKFNTRDAAGFFAARAVGIKTIILTGRECAATTRRMQELKADYVAQNVGDKVKYLCWFMDTNHIAKEQLAYIGDDLNDFASMQLAGYIACPYDACKEIQSLADYVSKMYGGCGVVRDVIEYLLSARGEWNLAVYDVYNMGV